LAEIDVPLGIYVLEMGTLPATIGLASIDPSYISEISGEEDVKRDNVKLGIFNWMENNYDLNIEFKRIFKMGDIEDEEVLTWYKIILDENENFEGESSYLIIDYPNDNIEFAEDYNEEPIGDGRGTSVPVNEEGLPKSIEFTIRDSAGAPGVEELGVYISPVLNKLNVISGKLLNRHFLDKEGKLRWGLFLVAIAILLTVALFAYILLYSWYKRNYEHKLFKNPNDLYNLVNFIYNSRRAGLKDGEIRTKLKEKTWSSEQLTYAFKKIDGKRTGMWEIPIFKFVENGKVKKQIEKRQGHSIDTRFIKRSGL